MRHQDPRGRWAADGGASTSYSLGPSAAPLPSSTQAEVLFDGRDKEDVDCHHHSLEERARRTVFTCAWCALCLAGSNVLGSKVLSLGGTALFWPGPPIVAMFLVLSPLFMQRWLASTAFAVYLVMILLDFGKLNECLFLNVLFMVTDATEVFVVMTCLRAVLGIAPVSIIRTGVGINAILLFPLVLAPLKAGLNALLIYMCYGALNLPLSETLVIWLIGDLFTDFFVVYSVLVVRYYLQLYLIKVKEMKMREREGRKEPEDAGRAETANAIGMGGSLRVPHGGPGESSVGGAGRTTPAVTNGESIYHFTQTRYENGGWGQEEGDEEESEKEWGSDDSEYEGEEEEEEEEEEDEEDEEDEEEEEEEEEDEEDDEEWKFENGGREIEPGECRNEEDAGRSDFPGKWSPYAPGSGVSHHRANGVRPGMVAKTEALGPGIPSNAAAVQQAGHPVKAWLHSPRMLWDVAAYVFFLSVSILTSFATILNHTRIARQPLFYLGSRLLFPVTGYVTVRYGQLVSCFIVGVVAISMLVTDFLLNEEQKTYGSVYITSFSTLFQALVCPTLIVIVSWSISYLAVALAERQDTLRLLRDKNAQLLAQEKELREAKLAAEQALSSKTEFFARVSHEFRTPLNVVLGFSEELIKPPPPGEGGQWVALTAETADRVQYILAAGESLLRVVDDILELFRLSSTHSQNGGQLLRVNMTAVDIPSFFGTVCDLVEVISKENGLHFIKHLDPALPRCLIIDRGRFSQLVMNLAFNACKYSRPAGGVVSIRLTNEGPVEDGRPGFITLRLDVQDNGPGIPPEVKDRIFESFFRGGPSMETMEVEEEEAAMPAAAGVPDCYSLPATGGGGGMRGGEMTGYFEDASQLPPGGQRHRGVGAASPYPSPGLPTTNSVSGVHTGFNAGLASGAGVRSQQYLAGASPPPLHASSAGTKAGSHPFPPVLPPPHRNYKAKGHGLGLAITKQLVDLLHGKITVRSSLGLGSLFSILLPAEVAEGSSYEESLAGPGGAGGGGRADGPPPVRDLKILSVEDILVNQIVLGGMLQQDGHRVVFVETGTAALSSIDPSFDLILLDLQLPDMHGIDVLKTLRKDADPLLAAMPIVVVSALVLDREKQECAQAGADGFITKPVKLGLLRQEIRSLWDSGRLRRREERGETGAEEHAAEERPAGERSGKEGGNSGIED